MHYELYVDSIFLSNFIMNLYLLIVVNRNTFRTATPGRLIAGAAVGAGGFLLPFMITAGKILSFAVGISVGTVGMLCIAFPVKSLKMFLRLLEKILIYSFALGGGFLFLLKWFPEQSELLTGVFATVGVGGILSWMIGRTHSGGMRSCLCEATLIGENGTIKATALIDSGNSLVEPISGKPVCIVEKKIFCGLWKNSATGFRAIPYHSVGRKKGILYGYLLPKMQVEVDGMMMEFSDIYIAVSKEPVLDEEKAWTKSVKIIINPSLFQGRSR